MRATQPNPAIRRLLIFEPNQSSAWIPSGVEENTVSPDNQNAPLMAPKEAAAATSLSRVYLSMMAANGHFPKPVRLGERRIAYLRAEVMQWIADRVAERAAA